MKKLIFVGFLGLFFMSSGLSQDFRAGKKFVVELHKGKDIKNNTFFCGCSFDLNYMRLNLEFTNSCLYRSIKNSNRRVKWTHLFPQTRFDDSLSKEVKICKNKKKEDKISCLRSNSKIFREIEEDVFNIIPVIEEIEEERKDYRFSDIDYENYPFGSCIFEVSHKQKTVEPRDDLKGDIARIMFHMIAKYKDFVEISKKEYKTFIKWNKNDPLSLEECKFINNKLNYSEYSSVYFNGRFFKEECAFLEEEALIK